MSEICACSTPHPSTSLRAARPELAEGLRVNEVGFASAQILYMSQTILLSAMLDIYRISHIIPEFQRSFTLIKQVNLSH